MHAVQEVLVRCFLHFYPLGEYGELHNDHIKHMTGRSTKKHAEAVHKNYISRQGLIIGHILAYEEAPS